MSDGRITTGDLEILIVKFNKTTALREITATEAKTGLKCEDSDENKARSRTDGGTVVYMK